MDHRTYTLVANGVPKWIELYRAHGREPQMRCLPKLVGYYYSEVGPLNQVVHIWEYDSFEDRLRRRADLFGDPSWKVFVESVVPIIVAQENKILLPIDLG